MDKMSLLSLSLSLYPQNVHHDILSYVYTPSYTVPGQVGNLSAFFDPVNFNSSSQKYFSVLNISWEEPVGANVVITSYEVIVTQTDNSSVIVYSDDSLTVTSVTQSVMVLPFTNYTVTVTASTSAGQGDPESVVELSPEAGN